MPDESRADHAEALARAVRTGDLEAAARVLAGVETLLALPSQTKAVAYLEEGGDPPEVLGSTTADGRFIPFYFTDGDHALDYLRQQGRVKEEDEAMLLMGGEPALRIRRCLERGFGGMVVNPGSSHAAVLDRETVRAVAGALKVGVPDVRGTGAGSDVREPLDPASARTRGPATPGEVLLQRAREAPDRAPVPAPDAPARECAERLQELRQAWREDEIPAWELMDGLAFELGVHVPVRPEPVFGLRWPLVSPHPDDPDRPAVRVFTDPDAARTALADLPDVEAVHLSGIEALRWIWASPARIDGVVFDLHPGTPGHLVIPDTWALGLLYPHSLDYASLEQVKRVPLGRLGELPGARGVKAESVRALVEGWGDLVELQAGADGAPVTVEHEGRSYLPAFSSPDRYFDFDSAHPDGSADPRPAGDAAPFREWLLASAGCDGVLLDPASRHPLPLDHTDLTVLALWTGMGSPPDGTDLVVGVESAADQLGERVAGRIVADWPRYYCAQQPASGDEAGRAMTLPRRDAYPFFTTEEKVGRFLSRVREWEMVDDGMKPATYLTGWPFNVFREMRSRYVDGGWINPRAMRVLESLSESGGTQDGAFDAVDPDAPDGDGLEVSPSMVDAALQRIDERLMPRVPGFVA